MVVLDRVIDLAAKWVNFRPGEIDHIRRHAGVWEVKQKEKGGIFAKMLKFESEWYVMLGAAILYMFANKWIADWHVRTQNPELFEDEDEHDQQTSGGFFSN